MTYQQEPSRANTYPMGTRGSGESFSLAVALVRKSASESPGRHPTFPTHKMSSGGGRPPTAQRLMIQRLQWQGEDEHQRPANMSVTTTDNARITSLRHVLADYDLTHSNPDESEAIAAPQPNAHAAPTVSNPPGWEDRWRRVPAYRPTNRYTGAEFDQRNTYTNNIERVFVFLLFRGVSLIAVSQ